MYFLLAHRKTLSLFISDLALDKYAWPRFLTHLSAAPRTEGFTSSRPPACQQCRLLSGTRMSFDIHGTHSGRRRDKIAVCQKDPQGRTSSGTTVAIRGQICSASTADDAVLSEQAGTDCLGKPPNRNTKGGCASGRFGLSC